VVIAAGALIVKNDK